VAAILMPQPLKVTRQPQGGKSLWCNKNVNANLYHAETNYCLHANKCLWQMFIIMLKLNGAKNATNNVKRLNNSKWQSLSQQST
jgi:hypothetical protein